LLPFGGAGPLHACDLADALQIRRILLPPMPGVLSAYGMLVADVARDASRSLLSTLGDLQRDRTPLQQLFQALAEEVQSALAQEGIAHPTLEAALDLRYRGQSYELTVPLALSLDEAALAAAGEAFHRAHEQRYGYAMPGETVETVNLRVRASSPGASAVLPALPDAGPDATAARLPERPVWFDPWEPTPTPCYDRERLQPGNRLAGPAIVHQFDTTIVITPGWQARVDAYRNIWLEKPQ
ncbi:5-oxoprolinase, partial [Litorilinea aerophila]